MIGTTLAHFKITDKLGEGGMGEVYRAEDTKLGRQVAIKVLPDAVAQDPERLARFEREAKVLATLNHPHIASIYSIESAVTEAAPDVREAQPTPPLAERVGLPEHPVHFLVMELVDGTTLQELIEQGVPVEKALEMAAQVAEALEEAHDQGIVHRDLKPANVKVTTTGKVKVLDFGLAKALDPDTVAGTGPDRNQSPLSLSPTLTAQMTQPGTILGTAAYMSPEQARGEEVDKRSDIWAFGVLLFELLCGQRLFDERSTTDVMAAVIRKEIDLDALPASVPGSIHDLLLRCLDRNPRNRLRDIGEARFQIHQALTQPHTQEPSKEKTRTARAWLGWLPWLVAGAAVAIAIALAFRSEPPQIEAPSRRLVAALSAPEGLEFSTSRGPMALSADGTRLAFVAIDPEGTAKLVWRSLESPDVRTLAGTEDASSPFWSPDGRSLGFFADRKLKRIDLDGGEPQVLADAPVPEGGTWNRDGVILYAPGEWGQPIMRVNASGGAATVVVDAVPDTKGDYHLRPSFLPDDERFLFSVLDQAEVGTGIYVGSIDSGNFQLLTSESGLHAIFVEPGYLLSWVEGHLRARTLDLDTLALGDEVVRIADRVASIFPSTGLFTASADGMLVYLPGEAILRSTELVWVDRQGTPTGLLGTPSEYNYPRLSHDGRRVVVDQSLPLADLWIFDVARAIPNRTTFSEEDETLPVWSADGSQIYYLRVEGTNQIYTKKLSGEEPPRLAVADGSPCDISPDGRYLLFRRDSYTESVGNEDLWTLDLTDGSEKIWLATPFADRIGRFSPDGRWVAYASAESGKFEIYLRSFPELGEKIPISTAGGTTPVWRSDGSELYYWSSTGEVMAVPIALSESPEIGRPEALFKARLRNIGGWNAQYDVSLDGQRFLLNRIVEVPSSEPLVLIQNWDSNLQEQP